MALHHMLPHNVSTTHFVSCCTLPDAVLQNLIRVSTPLRAFETHRSLSSSVYVPQLSIQVCTKVPSMLSRTKTSEEAKPESQVVSTCFSLWSTDVNVSGCTVSNKKTSPHYLQACKPAKHMDRYLQKQHDKAFLTREWIRLDMCCKL